MIQWFRSDTFESVFYSRHLKQNGFPKLVFRFQSQLLGLRRLAPPAGDVRGPGSSDVFCISHQFLPSSTFLFCFCSLPGASPRSFCSSSPKGPWVRRPLVAPGSSPPPTPLTPAACHFTSALGSHHTHTHPHTDRPHN